MNEISSNLTANVTMNERRLSDTAIERHWIHANLDIMSVFGDPIETPLDVSLLDVPTDRILILKSNVEVSYAYNGGRLKHTRAMQNDFGFLSKGSSVNGIFEQQVPATTIGIPDSLKEAVLTECGPGFNIDEPIDLSAGLINAQVYATLLDEFLLSGGIDGNLRAESLLTLLLGDLYRTVSKNNNLREDRRFGPSAIAMLEDYIDEHVDEKIDLETLAALVNVSQFHFVRRFKAITGLPPHQFVIRHRLEKVKSCLQKSDLALAQIAHDCGFSSQSHMSRLFRRYIGVTPANYRKGLSS